RCFGGNRLIAVWTWRFGNDMEVKIMNFAGSVCLRQKQNPTVRCLLAFLLPLSLGLLFNPASARGAALLYQTGFDVSEGYDANLDLVGQNGWVGEGSGGNGIL